MATATSGNGQKLVSTWIPAEELERLRKVAESEYRSVSGELKKLIATHLERVEQQKQSVAA